MNNTATRSFVLKLFVLMMVAMLLLAWRSEVFDSNQVQGQRDILKNQQGLLRGVNRDCLNRKASAEKFNILVDELEESVRNSVALPMADRLDRLKRYEAARIQPVVC